MGGFEPIEGQALGDMGTGPCPHENYAKVAVSIGLGDVVYSCIKKIPSVVAPHWELTHELDTFSVLKSDYMTQYLGVRHLMKINNNDDECPESKDIGTRSLSRQKVALIALITESFLVILSESWLLFGRVNNEPPMLVKILSFTWYVMVITTPVMFVIRKRYGVASFLVFILAWAVGLAFPA